MNKLLAVTGGSRGIGRATAEVFAENGFDIVTCGRSQDSLDAMSTEMAGTHSESKVFAVQADIGTSQGVEAFVRYVQGLDRPLDVLVNNAGIFLPGGVLGEGPDVLEQTMRTNVFGPYEITRGLVPEMISNGGGHIFNICSTASTMAYPSGASYCMSKFALLGFTKVLREEMKMQGVKVTAVLPGPTLTGSWEGSDIPAEKFIAPKEVGQLIFACWSTSTSVAVEELLIRPQEGDLI